MQQRCPQTLSPSMLSTARTCLCLSRCRSENTGATRCVLCVLCPLLDIVVHGHHHVACSGLALGTTRNIPAALDLLLLDSCMLHM